uniref:DNA directed RNA polymerase subunit L n=1 Tax=Mimivirus LCMiAC01 TaxID=2506608 RepID=A0A481YYR1_9VIRU|nr:MAG: DNA directed RNA polymerase subunit L [Mimivirus LCMiAC01]
MSFDIKIIELRKQKERGLEASELILEFSGKDVNDIVINTLRRLSYDYIPSYSFCTDTINIEQNNSIFNNDYMRLRISQMQIPNINHNMTYLPSKYWKNVKYYSKNRPIFPKDKLKYEIQLRITNTTSDVLNVTTNHIAFYKNDKQIYPIDKKYPHLILQLRPKEQFICNAHAVLGLGKNDNIWSAINKCYFDKTGQNKYKFHILSSGQLDEYDILHKACVILKEKLIEIKNIISSKYPTSSNGKIIIINLDNEDHTTGAIINDILQNRKDIQYSGLAKEDLLKDEITIKYITSNKNPIKPFFEALDHAANMFTYVDKLIKKIGKIK